MREVISALAGVLTVCACGTSDQAPRGEAAPGDASAGAAGGTDAAAGAAGSIAGHGGSMPEASLPDCPSFAAGVSKGNVGEPSLTEASGVVASRKNPGVLWVHNDSGDSARLFAIASDGTAQGTYQLEGATATDWEDLAIGPGPVTAETYLYVADIGDNAVVRTDYRLYRVPEPVIGSSPTTLAGAERIDLSYPDGSHNAESLFVDARNGDVYIVTKSSDGVSPIYRAAAPLQAGSVQVLEEVATLTFGAGNLPGNALATGADCSPSGNELAIRTYSSAFLWRRGPGVTIAEALGGEPCAIPLHSEAQGEALGFAADEGGYYTVSEGSAPVVWYFARAQ